MKNLAALMIAVAAVAMLPDSRLWYVGDERCPPPKDDGSYSAPYSAVEHPNDYPTFADADKPGWSCSYRREDGVIVQHGDSRTPQQQWHDLWNNANSRGD